MLPAYAVSVLMPVHNGGDYLFAAVSSILRQQGVLLELVIIDDNSTDGALDLLPDDPRVKLLRSPGRGIVSALNAGISASRHPFIARMDADDIAADHRLHAQLRHFRNNPGLDICGAKVKLFKNSGDIADGYRHYEKWINSLCSPTEIETQFFVESCIPHPSVMLRRTLLESLGRYHESAWPEDYDLWCRALLLGCKFGKPRDQQLLFWRDHSKRLSRNDGRYNKQMFLRCKAHYLNCYLQQRGISSCLLWGTGPTGLKLHDYLCESGMQVTGFIDVNPKMTGRSKRQKTVVVASLEPAKFNESYRVQAATIIVVAVSARGARDKIRAYLQAAGLTEAREFIFAA